MLRHILLIGVIAILTFIWSAAAVYAQDDSQPIVFLFVVDHFDVYDIVRPEGEGLRTVATHGGVALVNVRTQGGIVPGAGHVNMGAGQRFTATSRAGLALDADELWEDQPARVWYELLSGQSKQARIYHLGIAEMQHHIAASADAAYPGRLGSELEQAGIPRALYGNADTYEVRQRFGALLIMDEKGTVPRGNVGSDTTIADPLWPGMIRTNYNAVLEYVQQHMGEPGVVVVELGDFTRLEAVRTMLTPQQYRTYREATLQRVSDLLFNAYNSLQPDQQAIFLLVSPSPPQEQWQAGLFLTPLVVGYWPVPSQASTGFLMSNTTRRPGVVTQYDIAPTILQLFHMPTAAWTGHPMETIHHASPWQSVLTLYNDIVRVHEQRLPLIQPYFFLQLVVIFTTIVIIISAVYGVSFFATYKHWLLFIHLWLVAFPLALLLLPLLPPQDSYVRLWLQVILLSAALAGACWLFRRHGPTVPFTLLSLLTVVGLVSDMATGSSLMKVSHLGYDPIGGSRFYGIGNEFMGVLVGSVVIAAGGLMDTVRSAWRQRTYAGLIVIFAVIAVLLISPMHGANVGGMIGSVMTFTTLAFLFRAQRLRWPFLLVGALLIAVLLSGTVIFERFTSGADSHLGQAVTTIEKQGADPLWTLVERKISMNMRLIRLTVWSRAFFVSLLSALVFVFYPPRLVRDMLSKTPYIGLCIRGSLVGAVAILLANDSGIVASATFMIPVVSTLLYTVLFFAFSR